MSDERSLIEWAREFSGPDSQGVNELADKLEAVLAQVEQARGDFDCCKDGKCDGFIAQVNDGMSEAMAHEFDVPVIYGTGPRIYSTDADGTGIRREPDRANVEDLEKAGRKVFVTKGEERG